MSNVLRVSTIKTLLFFGLIMDISYSNLSKGIFFVVLFAASGIIMVALVFFDVRLNIKRHGRIFIPVSCNRQIIANVLRYLAVLFAFIVIFTTYSSSNKAERVDNLLDSKYVWEMGIPFQKIVYYVPDVSLDALELGITVLETTEDLQGEITNLRDTANLDSEEYFNKVNYLVSTYTDKLSNIETRMDTIKISHIVLAIKILIVELMFFISRVLHRGYILKSKAAGMEQRAIKV